MAISNLKPFNDALLDFADNVIPRRHLEMQKEIVIKLHELLSTHNFKMPKHPKDTGLAQGNWRVSVGDPPHDVIGSHEGPPPVRTPSQIAYQMRAVKGYQKVWVFNNVPYMFQLEAGNSDSAPEGIVGPALTEIKAFIESLEARS